MSDCAHDTTGLLAGLRGREARLTIVETSEYRGYPVLERESLTRPVYNQYWERTRALRAAETVPLPNGARLSYEF